MLSVMKELEPGLREALASAVSCRQVVSWHVVLHSRQVLLRRGAHQNMGPLGNQQAFVPAAILSQLACPSCGLR